MYPKKLLKSERVKIWRSERWFLSTIQRSCVVSKEWSTEFFEIRFVHLPRLGAHVRQDLGATRVAFTGIHGKQMGLVGIINFPFKFQLATCSVLCPWISNHSRREKEHVMLLQCLG